MIKAEAADNGGRDTVVSLTTAEPRNTDMAENRTSPIMSGLESKTWKIVNASKIVDRLREALGDNGHPELEFALDVLFREILDAERILNGESEQLACAAV